MVIGGLGLRITAESAGDADPGGRWGRHQKERATIL